MCHYLALRYLRLLNIIKCAVSHGYISMFGYPLLLHVALQDVLKSELTWHSAPSRSSALCGSHPPTETDRRPFSWCWLCSQATPAVCRHIHTLNRQWLWAVSWAIREPCQIWQLTDVFPEWRHFVGRNDYGQQALAPPVSWSFGWRHKWAGKKVWMFLSGRHMTCVQ